MSISSGTHGVSTSRTVPARLHVVSRGSGDPAVLFTHSFAGDVSHWDAALEHLESDFHVIAFDFSGHGQSPPAAGPYCIDELAEDIGAAADAAHLDDFVLVGHSLGASVAAEFAGSHARRVKALVLVDAPPAPGAIPPEQIGQLRAALGKDPIPVVEQFWNQQMLVNAREPVKRKLLADLHGMTRQAAAEITDALLRYDARDALRRYPGPKFAIVTPRNDAPLSLHNAVPGFRHAVIAGTSHWIQLDKPAEFNRTLDGFLASL